MSRNYDNWERLVAATLKREELRRLALASSRDTSFSSSTTARFNTPFNFKFGSARVNDFGELYFFPAILLADQLAKVSKNTHSFKQECSNIKSKAEMVAFLLWQAAVANHKLYHRPVPHIMGTTNNVLRMAIFLVLNCRGLKQRMFASNTSASLKSISSQLQRSIDNICWLLRDDQYQGIPPVAADEPILCDIWEQIAILHTGSVEDQCNAVAFLAFLVHKTIAYRSLISKEGCGVQPLLRLIQQGTPKAQEHAVTIIALLGKENRLVIDNMVWSVFMKILKDRTLVKLQGTVAWAVSELVNTFHVSVGDEFVHLLIDLICNTLQEISMISLDCTTGGVYSADRENKLGDESGTSLTSVSNRATEMEDPITCDYIKAMATKGLWRLALSDVRCCQTIIDSKALMCFVLFSDKGSYEVRYNSAMALMRISTVVAAEHYGLRRIATEPNMLACETVVAQLLRIIDHEEESEIRIPLLTVIFNLPRTFKGTVTRMIYPLVKLLDEGDAKISTEACIVLVKFAHLDNPLRMEYSKAIVDAGGLKRLVELVFYKKGIVQTSALTLLCHVIANVPRDEKVVEAKVLSVLKWASGQASLMQDKQTMNLLSNAIRVMLNY